jgi:hypothetical protein
MRNVIWVNQLMHSFVDTDLIKTVDIMNKRVGRKCYKAGKVHITYNVFGKLLCTRSPDLTPPDFYLWGAAKSAVCCDHCALRLHYLQCIVIAVHLGCAICSVS